MASRLVALTLDAQDPERLATFWGGLLDRAAVSNPAGPLLPGTDTQVGLRFTANSTPRTGANRIHLHLTSSTAEDQEQTIARALDLGGAHLDVGQLPEEDHVVLADPEGNALCVIGPGSSFLAGCGFLGEMACDGTRDVGVFWAAALDWPLVWDEDEETAVQSPLGGTKVAWGGPPVTPKHGRNRERFDLAVSDGDLAAELDRLVGLGASILETAADGSVELADPDGNEFRLQTSGS